MSLPRHAPDTVRVPGRGATLIELVVAMSVSAILIGLVALAWTHLSRHSHQGRRKTVFVNEAQRLAEGLAAKVRTSPAVLSWHTHGLSFISAKSGDTLHYEFFAEQLLRNDEPVTTVADHAWISDFRVEAEEGYGDRPSETALLRLTLTLADDFGNETSVTVAAAARVARDARDEEYEWDF